MNTLKLATFDEIEVYCNIIHEGRLFQREQGFIQWPDDYPSKDSIREDIELNRGYAFYVNGQPAAYMCIDFNGEPAYDDISEAWQSDEAYAVIHRIAISSRYRGKGLTGEIFALVSQLCKQKMVKSIRIDTYRMNERMQHVLKRSGFVYRGIVNYPFGERLAYEKLVEGI